MRISSWNVRGLSVPDKRRLVKRILTRLNLDIILLQETKLNSEKAIKFIKFCFRWEGLFQDARGSAGGLGILWNPSIIDVTPVYSSDHWMVVNVKHKPSNLCFPLFNVYGPSDLMINSKYGLKLRIKLPYWIWLISWWLEISMLFLILMTRRVALGNQQK